MKRLEGHCAHAARIRRPHEIIERGHVKSFSAVIIFCFVRGSSSVDVDGGGGGGRRSVRANLDGPQRNKNKCDLIIMVHGSTIFVVVPHVRTFYDAMLDK